MIFPASSRLTEELQNAFHAISQQMYASQPEAQSGYAPGGNANSHQPRQENGDVVEGEFREA